MLNSDRRTREGHKPPVSHVEKKSFVNEHRNACFRNEIGIRHINDSNRGDLERGRDDLGVLRVHCWPRCC